MHFCQMVAFGSVLELFYGLVYRQDFEEVQITGKLISVFKISNNAGNSCVTYNHAVTNVSYYNAKWCTMFITSNDPMSSVYN